MAKQKQNIEKTVELMRDANIDKDIEVENFRLDLIKRALIKRVT